MTKPPRKGRPRIEDRAKTIEAKQPWVAKGMSRSTWYRRKSEKTAPPAPAKRSDDGARGGTTNGERE
jgi:hypothetical protein